VQHWTNKPQDANVCNSQNLSTYLNIEKVIPAGFNYHLISVFGSQSTGKSTLLNYLFGTQFGVMAEQERRQTTKGIWMSKNKRQEGGSGMAENILVMDVEGTDGRERGEDQDFERKSALFALATSVSGREYGPSEDGVRSQPTAIRKGQQVRIQLYSVGRR
jgi:predicted GTPase